jgi:hypothetical protein
MHVTGMDDVHPAPDRATAQLWAAQWTIFWHRRNPVPHYHDPLMNFTVARWPWDAETHAASLAASIADNTFPVDPLAAHASTPSDQSAARAEGRREERQHILSEARRSLRLIRGCLECNADDERKWANTIRWLEALA